MRPGRGKGIESKSSKTSVFAVSALTFVPVFIASRENHGRDKTADKHGSGQVFFEPSRGFFPKSGLKNQTYAILADFGGKIAMRRVAQSGF
jgi:hypothetical protein